MPSWKKVIVSGSAASLSSLTTSGNISGSSTSTGSFAKLKLTSNITGSDVFTVDGLNGRLFTVTDEMSGSIFSANLISGLPVIEAFSDNRVNLGPFSSPIQIDSSGNISGSSTSTGSFGHVQIGPKIDDGNDKILQIGNKTTIKDVRIGATGYATQFVDSSNSATMTIRFGKVGIGTDLTNLSSKFVVAGDDEEILLRTTNLNRSSFIRFEEATDHQGGFIENRGNGNTVRLGWAHPSYNSGNDVEIITYPYGVAERQLNISASVDISSHITGSGNLEIAGNISGSATSTGSFGHLETNGIGAVNINLSDSQTNDISTALNIKHKSDGTQSGGIGVGIDFFGENSDVFYKYAQIAAKSENYGQKKAGILFSTGNNDTLTGRMRLLEAGHLLIGGDLVTRTAPLGDTSSGRTVLSLGDGSSGTGILELVGDRGAGSLDIGEIRVMNDRANTNSNPIARLRAITDGDVDSGKWIFSVADTSGTNIDVLHIDADSKISGSAISTGSFGKLLGDGSDLTGIITDLSGDTTPQLGGNLDLNSNDITGTGNIDITGNITAQNFIVSSSVTSITYQSLSGSTIFGDTLDDTHQFTGSLLLTGSNLTIDSVGGVSGSSSSTGSFGRTITKTMSVDDVFFDGGDNPLSVNPKARFFYREGQYDTIYGDIYHAGGAGGLTFEDNYNNAAGGFNFILQNGTSAFRIKGSGDGDITFTGDISGSSTSTGSFGQLETVGDLIVADATNGFKVDASVSGHTELLLNNRTIFVNDDIIAIGENVAPNDLAHQKGGGAGGRGSVYIGNEAGESVDNSGGGAAHNTFIGDVAGQKVTSGIENTFLGSSAGGSVTTGDDNVAIGRNALLSNITGNENTAVGYNSGAQVKGDGNITVGYSIMAVASSDTNDKNTFIGYKAAQQFVSGSNNIAMGSTSHQFAGRGGVNILHNIGIGYRTNYVIRDGDYNISMGYESLRYLRHGDKNVAIGYLAGRTIGASGEFTSGSKSVYIGQDTRTGENNSSNEIVIGSAAVGKGSNTVVLGDDNVTDIYMSEDVGAKLHTGDVSGSSTSTGSFGRVEASNVNISVDSAVGLTVDANSGFAGLRIGGASGQDSNLYFGGDTNGFRIMEDASESTLSISSGGSDRTFNLEASKIGINTQTPQGTLDVTNTGVALLDIVSDSDANSSDTDVALRFFVDGVSGTGTQKGLVRYNQGDDIFGIGYGSNDHLKINSSGNLEVAGNISGSSTSTGSFGQLRIVDDIVSTDTVLNYISDNYHVFYDADDLSTPAVSIVGNNKRLGIGVLNPGNALEVVSGGKTIGMNDDKINFSAGMVLEATNNVWIDFDNANSSTARTFKITHDDRAETLFQIDESGDVEIPVGNVSGSSTSTGSFGNIQVAQDFLPTTDNNSDLGAADKRWANIYSADLQLSNEGTEGNEVDGTTGNWTIQEGKDDLYLLNRKNGKKYKFKLEEVT